MIWKALIVGLIAFAVLTAWKSARMDRVAEATYPPQGRIITVAGKRVHVEEMGAGPLLVLLHGAGGSTRDMTTAMAGSMARTHRVILFDRPGHGHSEPLHDRGESLDEQAQHILRALDQMGLKNDPFLLAGYSYGGSVALAMTLAAPDRVRGLLLIAAVTNRWEIPPSWTYDLMGLRGLSWLTNPVVSAWLPKDYVRRSFEGIYAPETPPDALMDDFGAALATRKVTLRTNARQVLTLLPQVKAMEPRYSSITVPVEIVHGDQDNSVSVEIHGKVFVKSVQQANLTVLPGVGHGIHNTNTDAVLAALARLP